MRGTAIIRTVNLDNRRLLLLALQLLISVTIRVTEVHCSGCSITGGRGRSRLA